MNTSLMVGRGGAGFCGLERILESKSLEAVEEDEVGRRSDVDDSS